MDVIKTQSVLMMPQLMHANAHAKQASQIPDRARLSSAQVSLLEYNIDVSVDTRILLQTAAR